MGLFSIFKKKTEQEAIVVPSDSIKGLTEGILFEGEGAFIKWGANPEDDKRYAKKEFRADRTIYQWGERTILNGLTLPLKTICWNHKQHGDTRSFESIEFLNEGGDAEKYFRSIRGHLESIFDMPKQEEDLKSGDISLEWKVKSIKLSLSFFNKEQKKVHFEIGWWL